MYCQCRFQRFQKLNKHGKQSDFQITWNQKGSLGAIGVVQKTLEKPPKGIKFCAICHRGRMQQHKSSPYHASSASINSYVLLCIWKSLEPPFDPGDTRASVIPISDAR